MAVVAVVLLGVLVEAFLAVFESMVAVGLLSGVLIPMRGIFLFRQYVIFPDVKFCLRTALYA